MAGEAVGGSATTWTRTTAGRASDRSRSGPGGAPGWHAANARVASGGVSAAVRASASNGREKASGGARYARVVSCETVMGGSGGTVNVWWSIWGECAPPRETQTPKTWETPGRTRGDVRTYAGGEDVGRGEDGGERARVEEATSGGEGDDDVGGGGVRATRRVLVRGVGRAEGDRLHDSRAGRDDGRGGARERRGDASRERRDERDGDERAREHRDGNGRDAVEPSPARVAMADPSEALRIWLLGTDNEGDARRPTARALSLPQ